MTDRRSARNCARANYSYFAAAEALHLSTLYDRTRTNQDALSRAEDISDEEVLAAYDRNGGDVQAMARKLRCSRKPMQNRVK